MPVGHTARPGAIGMIVLTLSPIASGTRTLKVTDTDPNLDLHVVQFSRCTADPILPGVVANGAGDSLSPATVTGIPATGGKYYIIVDGRDDANGIGYVGKDTVTIAVTTPQRRPA